jgi:peptide/nickel transport system permease protein
VALGVGTGVLLLLTLVALFAGRLAGVDPFAATGEAFRPPSGSHVFGTDDLGRDVFSGVVHGASASLTVGFAAAVLSGAIGIAVGGLAGVYSGAVDLAFMRATEFAQALPRFFLIVTLVTLFGGRFWFIVAALGLTAWPATARVFRVQVLAMRESDFVIAARAAGARDVSILVQHILPLALPVIGAQLSYQAGGAILSEAGLSFLGLGDPTVMTWGAELGSAQHFVRDAWWMPVFPGLAITLTVMACNLIADAAADRPAPS